MSNPAPRTGSAHAVVIGASIAGCLAARVLSDHYDTVTIVERDNLPDTPVTRGGVPQTRHFHQLLARGREVMEQLVPGLTEDLLREGAQMVDSTQALVWLTPAGWAQRYESGLHVVGVSRDLLEWVLRSRVCAIPNIQVLAHIEVTGLAIDPADGGVSGVHLRPRGESRQPETLTADLVVDASGRTSKMPQWLTDVGYEAPAETVVDVGMGYASRFYTIPEGFEADWKAIYIQAAPPLAPRSGIMIEIERGRWLISVNGIGADARRSMRSDSRPTWPVYAMPSCTRYSRAPGPSHRCPGSGTPATGCATSTGSSDGRSDSWSWATRCARSIPYMARA